MLHESDAPSDRKKELLFQCVAIGAVLALFGVAILVVILATLPDDLPAHTKGQYRTWDPEIGRAPLPRVIAARNPPGLDIPYTIFTDSRGARVDHEGAETGPKADAIVVGGSFPFGFGLSNQQTFPALLAQKLGIEVANFAMPGAGTVSSLLMLERNLDLAPEAVIYPYMWDHGRRNQAPCWTSGIRFCSPQAYVVADGGEPYIQPPRRDQLQEAAIRQHYLDTRDGGIKAILWRINLALFGRWRYHFKPSAGSPGDDPAIWNFLLERMAKASPHLTVIHIPNLAKGRTHGAPRFLLDAASKHADVFLDLAPAIQQHYDNGGASLRYPTDMHPNANGHEFFAGETARALRDAGLFQD